MEDKESEDGCNLSKRYIHRSSGFRMISKLSFLFVLIVVGVPLWWKTTEVERNYFPYADIEVIRSEQIQFMVPVFIYSNNSEVCNRVAEKIQSFYSSSTMFKLETHKYVSVDLATASTSPSLPGSIHLQEMSSLKNGEVLFGHERTIYFSSEPDFSQLRYLLDEYVLRERDIFEAIQNVMSKEHVTPSQKQLRTMRLSTNYDIVFTTIFTEPGKYQLQYDQQKVIKEYFEPFIQQFSPVANFTIRSQWLFDFNLNVQPRYATEMNRSYYAFPHHQIPRVITPLENYLGSGVSQWPRINFILYVPRCSQTPLYFSDKDETVSITALCARWGGVQILNARQQHCNGSKSLVPNVEVVMKIFFRQFKLLMGLEDAIPNALLTEPVDDRFIPQWEIDSLCRFRIAQLFISAKLTLSSLSQLLEEISNIVITKEVSEAVVKATEATKTTLSLSKEGIMNDTLHRAKESFTSSEYAFTHPSLLALLYFPDDQKYAVYIPLYLPVMIPVIFSLRSIYEWFKHWYSGVLIVDFESSEESDGEDTQKEDTKSTDELIDTKKDR